jgi:arylsulfatase A-like enzyme
MNDETAHAKKKDALTHFFALQLFAALLFYFCDVLLSSRNFWMGWSPSEWAATAPGVLVYGIYLIFVSGFITALVRRFVFRKMDVRLISSMTTPIAVGILTLVLHQFALPRVEPFVLDYGMCAAGGVAAVGLLGAVKRSISWTVLGGVVGIVSGLSLLQVFATTLVTMEYGVGSAAVYSAGWAGTITLFGAIVYITGNRNAAKKTISTIGIAAVSFALPMSLWIMAPVGDSAEDTDQKNVVIITADTMRADYLSMYGGPVPTPNLDRIATKGMRFDQHYSLAPWTVPSIPGMFSSKYPPSVTLDIPMKDRTVELSYYRDIDQYWEGEEGGSFVQHLSDSGYSTGAVVGNFALYGYDWLLGDFNSHLLLPFVVHTQRGPLDGLPLLSGVLMKAVPDAYEDRPPDFTKTVTEYALAFLKYRTKRNFLLWVHYLDPHAPYDPPKRFRRISEEPYDFFPHGATAEMRQEHEYIKSLYEGEIRYVDESIGKILDAIAKEGHDDDTFVLFSSDHGEEFWDHNGFGHGLSLYNEQLRVPLVMAGPGIEVGTVQTPVSAIDIIPTLADLLGEDRYGEWRGSGFASVLQGGPEEKLHQPVFSQATGLLPPPPEPLQSVVVWPYKLIRGMETGASWLYNLETDSGETTNLAEGNADLNNALARSLATWSTTFPVTFEELKNENFEINVHEDTIENLKALGYLD